MPGTFDSGGGAPIGDSGSSFLGPTPGFGPGASGTGDRITNPDIWLGLPPGGTVDTPQGGVAPGSTFPIPAGGGGGFDISKLIPALIPAAGGLIGMFKGQGGATDKAISAMNKSTGPIQAAGNQALAGYTSGKLTPTQQAKVDEFKKQNLAKWRQYLANAGIPEGSAMADIEAKVNQDAQAYADTLLQQDFNNAYQATGLASTNLGRVAQMQALQDAEQRKQWEAFMQALGGLGTAIPNLFG